MQKSPQVLSIPNIHFTIWICSCCFYQNGESVTFQLLPLKYGVCFYPCGIWNWMCGLFGRRDGSKHEQWKQKLVKCIMHWGLLEKLPRWAWLKLTTINIGGSWTPTAIFPLFNNVQFMKLTCFIEHFESEFFLSI